MRPMLAKNYAGENIQGWLLSEKLDGVRAIWTGSVLVTRNGNDIIPPAWFTSQLPRGEVLDGELYSGRGTFQKTVAVIRKKTPIDSEWEQIRYRVFDAPACSGGFETRIAYAKNVLWVRQAQKIASVIPHWTCPDADYLKALALRLVSKGAEGVVLRKPGSPYVPGRSGNVLKYKPRETDEARVIGYQEGKGKYSDQVGALVCQWRDGITIRLGTGLSDETRLTPPKIGSMVTFSYRGLTDTGVPREAVFVTVRDYE